MKLIEVDEIFKNALAGHSRAIEYLSNNQELIINISVKIAKAILDRKTIFIAGNGGSASDAQHFAAELVGRFQRERDAYPSICLNTDTSILTAVGNDYGFENVFSRQILGLGKRDDIFIGISTSGNSKNIIHAVNAAKKIGLQTICLLGKDGGELKTISDYSIIISSKETARTQEAHITVIHIMCKIIEDFVEGEILEKN